MNREPAVPDLGVACAPASEKAATLVYLNIQELESLRTRRGGDRTATPEIAVRTMPGRGRS
jgi:hypothetical protein